LLQPGEYLRKTDNERISGNTFKDSAIEGNPQPCPLRLPEVAFSADQNIAMEIVSSGSPTEILFEFTGIKVEKSP